MKSDGMFARINICADARTGEIDLGFLAECLIFYDCVFVIGGLSKVANALAGSAPAIEVVDAVVFDRLLKGWRPNQFVDKSLKSFVKTEQ